MTYDFVNRTVTSPDLADNPHFPGWLAAVHLGFHQDRPSDTVVAHQLTVEAEHRSTLRGVYARGGRGCALPTDQPVATFTQWEGSLNLGGALVDVQQISDVTVRSSHRRRGLLRRLMTDCLSEATANGLAVAALTATEATIYGRFGFGPAVFQESIELQSNPAFALTSATAGTVDYLDPAALDSVAKTVFEDFHRLQTGSIRRGAAMRKVLTGELDHTTRETDRGLRAAAHWDDDGRIDGYATWVAKDHGSTVEVRDLLASTESASLALWEFLGALDLVKRVTARRVRRDDPLPWALADRRWYTVLGSTDMVWLRILDPQACLAARTYVHDGQVTVTVVDDLGLANGTWQVRVNDGHADITPVDPADAEVELDIAALGSGILGGVRVSALQAAGLIRGKQKAIDALESLLARRRAPWCATPF